MKEGSCPPQKNPWSPQRLGRVMVVRDFSVDFPLSSHGHVCHLSRARHGYVDVGSCHCVSACGIPNDESIQGVMVILLGHLPPEWDSPCGSNTDRMLTLARDCLMMVLATGCDGGVSLCSCDNLSHVALFRPLAFHNGCSHGEHINEHPIGD